MVIFLRFLVILIVVHTANSCSTYIGSPTTASGTRAPKKEYFRPGELIFEENFDAFDLDTWNHAKTMAGGGNWEFQYYNNNRTNSYVEDGNLHIVPTFTADEEDDSWLYTGTMNINGGSPGDHCTDPSWSGCERSMAKDGDIINPIKSALLRSVHSFNYKFGKLEVRAKMPSGDWLWPAIWLMPKVNLIRLQDSSVKCFCYLCRTMHMERGHLRVKLILSKLGETLNCTIGMEFILELSRWKALCTLDLDGI